MNKKLRALLRPQEDFWILWQKESDLPPRQQFSTFDAAMHAAEVMAKNWGKRFYIVHAEGYAEPIHTPVQTTRFKVRSK